MLKISRADCPGLPPVMSAQFTLEMCVAAWNREKFTTTPFWRFKVVQSRSRSFKIIDVGTPGKLVSSTC